MFYWPFISYCILFNVLVSNIYLQSHNRGVANSIASAVWNVFVSAQANKPPGEQTKFSKLFMKK